MESQQAVRSSTSYPEVTGDDLEASGFSVSREMGAEAGATMEEIFEVLKLCVSSGRSGQQLGRADSQELPRR